MWVVMPNAIKTSGIVTGKIKRFASVTKNGVTKTKGDVTDYAMPISEKVKANIKNLKSKLGV